MRFRSAESARLFAYFRSARALVLGVSGGAPGYDAVRRQALARRYEHHHAGLKRGGVNPAACLVGADDHRASAHVAEQRGHPAARAIAHHAVEPATAEQEEEQHHHAVEIGVGTVRSEEHTSEIQSLM